MRQSNQRFSGFSSNPEARRRASHIDKAVSALRPQIRIASNAEPGAQFIAAAIAYRLAARELMAATAAHARWAAANTFDDPGHGDHQERIACARRVLAAAEREFEAAQASVVGRAA